MSRIIGVLAGLCVPLACFGTPEMDQDITVAPRPGIMWRSPTLTPAQPPQVIRPSTPLTLAELTDSALRNNPSTREAWAAANAQAAALGIAEAEYYPALDANVLLTRGKTSINSTSGVTSGSTQTRLIPSITLSYVLFDFGGRAANKQAVKYELIAANLKQNRALQDVVSGVEQAYYQLLAATQTIAAAEETLKSVQLSVDVVNARRTAGLATIGEVYQAETVLAQARLQLRRAQGEESKLKGALCNAMGLPINTVLELAPLAEKLPTPQVRLTIDQYLDQAKAARPDLVSAEAQARAARENISAASAQGYPSLELAISAGKTYNNVQDDFNNGSSNNSIGLNLRVPLFHGFRTTHTIRQAQARAAQLDAARDRAALQVELEVWQAYFDLDTAGAAIDGAHALLRSASQSREVAQERYKAGVGNLPDLLLAQANEANARMEVIQSEMGWHANLSRLNNAVGMFSSELVEPQ